MLHTFLDEYTLIYTAEQAQTTLHAELERDLFLRAVSYGVEMAHRLLSDEEIRFFFGDPAQPETLSWRPAFPAGRSSYGVRITSRLTAQLELFADLGSGIAFVVDIAQPVTPAASLTDPEGRRKLVSVIGRALVRAGILDPLTHRLTLDTPAPTLVVEVV